MGQNPCMVWNALYGRRRRWHPTPVFLPGESQGWGSLVGCCLWGRTESDTTEATQQQQQVVLVVQNPLACAGDVRHTGSIPESERYPGEGLGHPGVCIWRILWTEEPGGLQSMELQRAGHLDPIRAGLR